MFKISRQLIHPTKGNAILIFLILILGFGIASYFLQNNPDEAQAQGTNIQDILHIGNAAPSVDGGWQTGSYGGGRALWRYRVDGHYGDPDTDQDECWRTDTVFVGSPPQATTVETPLFCDPNQSTSNYSLNLGNNSANYLRRRAELDTTKIHRYQFTHNPSRIINQTPFLVVGYTPPGGSGFDDPELQLDLWIPSTEDITSLRMNSRDAQAPGVNTLCNDTWDNGAQNVGVTIQGKDAGQEQTIIAANSCGGLSSTITSALGEPIETALLTITPGVQREYKKYIITAKGPDNVSFANQFRLNITQPANSFLVAAASDNYTGDIEDANSFNISNRLPGGSSPAEIQNQYKRLEILWETTIYVAPNSEDGCSYNDDRYVGLYDSDYPTNTQGWIKKNSYPPRLEISSVDRNSFLDSPSSTGFVVEPGGNLTFNGSWDALGERTFVGGNELVFKQGDAPRNVDQNKWEDKLVHFEGDKIYKLRFYSMDQRTWVQIRLPFDQINALQKCAFKPLFKVFYSDISAGGRFGLGETSDACRNQIDIDNLSTTYAGLYAHTIGQELPPVIRPPTFINVQDSSSAEYGTRVRNTIQTFYSGFKNTVPSEANRLTFANTTSYYGGDFGKSRCIPNYWRGASSLDFVPTDTLDIGTIPGPANVAHKPDIEPYITLTNASALSDLKLKATIYIEGDLLIKSDIYNNSSGAQWKNFNEINYITIIVKGDILIDPSVSRIDAVLIAYPNTGADIHNIEDDTKGRIYTCYPDWKNFPLTNINIDNPLYYLDRKIDLSVSGLTHNSQIYNESCDINSDKLVVNGALIAREIHLGRTYVNKVQPYVIGYAVSEEINLLPEYFIGTPNLPGFEDWLHRSDSIHILPVNF